MIGPADALRRLLAAGLVAAAEVVDGDVVVRSLARSNAVYLVTAGGREVVCKSGLAERPVEQGSAAREHALYRAVADDPGLRALGVTPALVADLGDLLVLDRVEPGDTLEERLRTADAHAPDAARLGQALGAWHRHATALAPGGAAAPASQGPELRLPGHVPWVFDALGPAPPAFVTDHEPMAALREQLRAGGALRDGLAGLAAGWRRTALIHGDVRWDNALVAGAAAGERVVLVDWEFVDAGDPGWDIACALAEPVALVVLAEGGEAPPPDAAALAAALAEYAAGLRDGYRAARGEAGERDDLRRGADLVPARLVQIAFQHAAWDPRDGVATGLRLGAAARGLLAAPEPLRDLLCPATVP